MMSDNKLIYQNSKITLEIAGLLIMEEYIAKRKKMVTISKNSTEIFNKYLKT